MLLFVLALAYLFALVAIIVVSLGFIFVIRDDFVVDAPFVPIPAEVVDRIVQEFSLNANSVLYDLGSGDGRVLIALAKRYPEARFIGVDKAWVPFVLSKIKTRNHSNIEILRKDFFDVDLSEATHIYGYLFPQVIDRVLEKHRTSFREGLVFCTVDFESKASRPVRTAPLRTEANPGKLGNTLFVYSF